MGLAKNYLRYAHDSTLGLVAASQVGSSIKFLRMRNTTDRFVAVPANENVFIWDLKTRQILNKLIYDDDNSAEVTVFDCYQGGHSRTNLIAVGYANGRIRVFEYETGLLKITFTGHRTSISALAFDKDGSRLASGGKDCKIVLWDIVGERGMFSLAGHKNSISKLEFLHNEEHQKDLIVSSSIDAVSTIKFWDIQTQHCFCTIPGQLNGVWSFALIRNGTRLIAGSSSAELKVYSIEFLCEHDKIALTTDDRDVSEGFMDEATGLLSSEAEYGLRVKFLGNILRNSTSISNRVQEIVIDKDESLMICYSIDKNIELYGLRTQSEALAYAKKQTKKALRKLAKRKKADSEENDDEVLDDTIAPVTSLDSLEPQRLVDCEFNRRLGCRRLSDKLKALTLSDPRLKDGKQLFTIACMSSSNKIDCYQLDLLLESQDSMKSLNSIGNESHRTDVKAVSISKDNTLMMSASSESVKLWRIMSQTCTVTIDTEPALCCTFVELPGSTSIFTNRYGIIGTKLGNVQILDFAEARVANTYCVCNDQKPLNSISLLPDNSGIVCAGEDGIVRFYKYKLSKDMNDDESSNSLTLEEERDLAFQEGITCVKVSSNNNLLAVALLDSTVRVHFMDTFKYFLTMYGHKFPVTTMDMSDDNTLIVTGSPDKNIKIWGLDFGDCHKSIFAHDDAITSVKFLPKTHYVVSCGRDRCIKQWDGDHFIKIQTFRRHHGEVWCLAVSPNGKLIATASHDRSIRLYRRTEEIIVPTEEEEAEREMEDERNVFEKQEFVIVGERSVESTFASKMTIEMIKSADRLIEAIDVFGNEQAKDIEHKKQCQLADSKGEPLPTEPERDPLLMTANTTDYHRFMLEMLRRVKSSELEDILITLPFDYVRRLLIILVIFLERSWDVELMARCATFLLKINFGQIAASPAMVPIVVKLRSAIMDRSFAIRKCAGFNLMALEHLSLNKKYSSTKLDTI